MTTLSDCLGHEPGYLNMVLDILLRRGIITPSAAIDWATSASVLENLHTSYWPHRNLEVNSYLLSHIALQLICRALWPSVIRYRNVRILTISQSYCYSYYYFTLILLLLIFLLMCLLKVIVDRTLDVVRAAIANRHDLGGEMKMDESATMASFLQSKAFSRPVSTGQRDNAMEVQGEGEVVIGARIDGDGDDEGGGEGDARRNRRRREEDEAAQADEANQEVKDITAACHLPLVQCTMLNTILLSISFTPSLQYFPADDPMSLTDPPLSNSRILSYVPVSKDEDDPVSIATEAVHLALDSARTVYLTLIGR